MTHPAAAPPAKWTVWLPSMVFVAGLLIAFAACKTCGRLNEARLSDELARQTQAATAAIVARVQGVEKDIRSTRGPQAEFPGGWSFAALDLARTLRDIELSAGQELSITDVSDSAHPLVLLTLNPLGGAPVARLSKPVVAALFGRQWAFVGRADAEFAAALHLTPPEQVFGLGVAFSLLAAALATGVAARVRARQLDVLLLEQAATTHAKKLEAIQRMLTSITDAMPSMIGYWDTDLINCFANRAYQTWFGIDARSIRGMHMRELLGVTLFEKNRLAVDAALRGDQVTFERECPDPCGGERTTHLVHYIPDVCEGVTRGFFVMVNDLTPLKEAQRKLTENAKFMERLETLEAKLAEAARTDKLTGLANRALFMERLEKAVIRVRHQQQASFAVLFLDFDRFKMINDTLGHESGDMLLRHIAQRLRSELRVSDTLSVDDPGNVVSRFGGDEFLILVNDINTPSDAPAIAERLLNVLAPAYLIDGSEVHSTASIGIVTSDQCHSSAEDVVRNADLAMYEAKHAGRACSVVFNEAMHTRLARHMTIENSLRHAIGTTDMYLVYQPIVDIETGQVVSVEALVRWTHPVLGVIAPSEFIPIAEESHLIIALGQWVQREACKAMVKWRVQDPRRAPKTMSVNISRAELGLGQLLIDQVRRTLAEVGLPAECLQLEVTEREVMRHPEAAHASLHALQKLGIQLAMDDFGTGTSSLGFLRNYPFNTIKIDRSFIQDVTCSADVLAVIHATINLVENLGMISLAEGVEDGAQLALLQSLGCRYAQGYFLSHPVAAEVFLATVKSHEESRSTLTSA